MLRNYISVASSPSSFWSFAVLLSHSKNVLCTTFLNSLLLKKMVLLIPPERSLVVNAILMLIFLINIEQLHVVLYSLRLSWWQY